MKLFEDLPSQNTPITAERLNQIQDNLVVVSATEPTGDSREKVWIQKGKNLFNKNNVTENVWVHKDTGVKTTDSSSVYVTSEYINVENLKQITFSASIYGTAINPGFCFYDKNKTYISGIVAPYGSKMLDIPNNATYLVASVLKTQLDTVQIEQGTIATTYEAYIEPKIYVKNDNGVYEEFISENRMKDLVNKIIEVEKISITLSEDFSSGVINCFKSGKVVVVEVSDVQIKEDKAEWSTILATGLPKLVGYGGGWVKGVLPYNRGFIQMAADGELMVCERTGTQKATSIYNGQLVYMTID